MNDMLGRPIHEGDMIAWASRRYSSCYLTTGTVVGTATRKHPYRDETTETLKVNNGSRVVTLGVPKLIVIVARNDEMREPIGVEIARLKSCWTNTRSKIALIKCLRELIPAYGLLEAKNYIERNLEELTRDDTP